MNSGAGSDRRTAQGLATISVAALYNQASENCIAASAAAGGLGGTSPPAGLERITILGD